MAQSVYTIRIGFQKNSSAWTSADVPPGFVWVVRDISGVYAGSLGVTATFAIGNVGIFALDFAPLATGSFHYDGRAVMEAGDHMDMSTSGDGIDFVVTAYQLFLP